MIPAHQALISTSDLAAELGKSPDTVTRWGRTKLRGARHSRGVYLVQKLRDMGVLNRVDSAPTQAQAMPLGGLVVITTEELRVLIREELARMAGPTFER